MNESSNVILMYSNLYEQNHPEILDKAKKLGIAVKYTDCLLSSEHVWKLIHMVSDLQELIQRTKWPNLQDMLMSTFIRLLLNEPDRVMVSAIMISKDKDGGYKYYAINSHEIERWLDKLEDPEWLKKD